MPLAGTGCPRSSADASDASIALVSTIMGSIKSWIIWEGTTHRLRDTYHLNFLAIIVFLNEYLVFKVVSLALW